MDIAIKVHYFLSSLVTQGFKPDHFTHIFIDEAGHAMEPEALIPVAGLFKVSQSIRFLLDSRLLGKEHGYVFFLYNITEVTPIVTHKICVI